MNRLTSSVNNLPNSKSQDSSLNSPEGRERSMTTMIKRTGVQESQAPWNRLLMPGRWCLFQEEGVDVGMVEFTPDVCGTILENHNANNRPVTDRQVKFLSHVLTSDQWMLTGETIIFSDQQQCLNGQQRCMACKETGIPFKSLVAVGVTPEAFKVMDQHRKRSLGQVLTIEGHTSTNVLAGALNWVASFFERGVMSQSGLKQPLTTEDYLNLLDKHPDLAGFVSQVCSFKYTKIYGGASLPAAFLYLTSRVNEPLALRMFEVIQNSTIPETPEWNMVRLLSQQLTANLTSNRKLKKTDIAALLIKTWNSLLTGKVGKSLLYRGNEDFPKIVGWVYEDGKPTHAKPTECPHYQGATKKDE
jgi:hypothetical protein